MNILSATNLDYVTPYTILTFTFRVDWKRLCWTLGQEPYLYLARSFCLLFPIILHTPRGISISLSKKKKRNQGITPWKYSFQDFSHCVSKQANVSQKVYIFSFVEEQFYVINFVVLQTWDWPWRERNRVNLHLLVYRSWLGWAKGCCVLCINGGDDTDGAEEDDKGWQHFFTHPLILFRGT